MRYVTTYNDRVSIDRLALAVIAISLQGKSLEWACLRTKPDHLRCIKDCLDVWNTLECCIFDALPL